MSEMGRRVGPGGLAEAEDALWPNRIVSLRFDGQSQRHTVMALVKDPTGQTVKTITCRSGALSPERARTEAMRGVVIDLLDYFQMSGAEAGVTAAEPPRPAHVNPPSAGQLEAGTEE
jgi:hypothetical protein